MITVHQALQQALERLREKVSTPLLDSQVILCCVLNVDRLYLIINKDKILTKEETEEYNKLIGKRFQGLPVQYITGSQEFMGLMFHVEEGVLIPRPDTEILIEKVLDRIDVNNRYNIVDIGTGSGAISVSLAKFIEGAYIYSIDISRKAIDMGRKNAENNGVGSKISFLNGDLFKPLEKTDIIGKVDILVSNPPYIPTEDIEDLQIEVSRYEPRIALDGGIDGLNFYRKIIDGAPKYLKEDGLIALEVGYNQSRKVIDIMGEKGKYIDIQITKDLAGIERVISGRIKK